MDDSSAFLKSLLSGIANSKSTSNYLKLLVDFSSNEDNLELIPKYFSQINPLLVSSSSKILFIYLKDLESNKLKDNELLQAISLVVSLKDNYTKLYDSFSNDVVRKASDIHVIRGGFYDADLKLKYILKYANSKSFDGIEEIICDENTPIDFKDFVVTLIMLLSNDVTGIVTKIVRCSEFYDVLMHMYSSSVPSSKSGKISKDWFSFKIIEFITECVCDNTFIPKMVVDVTNVDSNRITELQKSISELKKQIKINFKSDYVPTEKLVDNKDYDGFVDELSIINIDHSLDSPINKSRQLEAVSKLSVLLIKADELNLASLPSNFRIEVASRVDDSVLSSNEFDIVMVLTKSLKHKDFYRVKSNIHSKLVLSSSTNRGRIISDLFYGI